MKRTWKSSAKTLVRAGAIGIARAVARNAWVKRSARSLLGRVPALERRVDRLLGRAEPLPPRRMHVPQDSSDLSPLTRTAYEDVQRHFKSRKP